MFGFVELKTVPQIPQRGFDPLAPYAGDGFKNLFWAAAAGEADFQRLPRLILERVEGRRRLQPARDLRPLSGCKFRPLELYQSKVIKRGKAHDMGMAAARLVANERAEMILHPVRPRLDDARAEGLVGGGLEGLIKH